MLFAQLNSNFYCFERKLKYVHFFVFSFEAFLFLLLVAVFTGGNIPPNNASNVSFFSVLLLTFGVLVFAAGGGALATGELLKFAGLGGSKRPSLKVDPGEYGDDMSTTLSFVVSIVASLPFCPIVELFLLWLDLEDRAMVDDFAEFVNTLGSCGLSFVRCFV